MWSPCDILWHAVVPFSKNNFPHQDPWFKCHWQPKSAPVTQTPTPPARHVASDRTAAILDMFIFRAKDLHEEKHERLCFRLIECHVCLGGGANGTSYVGPDFHNVRDITVWSQDFGFKWWSLAWRFIAIFKIQCNYSFSLGVFQQQILMQLHLWKYKKQWFLKKKSIYTFAWEKNS